MYAEYLYYYYDLRGQRALAPDLQPVFEQHGVRAGRDAVGPARGSVRNLTVRTYTPDDIVQSLMKRRWLILVPFALGLAATPLLARFAPEKYRSETLIMVVPQRVPDSYVKATVTESIEDRLPSISEQILSRSRLERIITDMDLYKDRRARQVMEDVVQGMREDVTVTLVGQRENSDSFRVSYVSDHADTARKVTERLASLYIEQNLKDRENQAESTSQFLDTQLQEAKQRLLEQEKKLEAYRKQHSGELPTQLQGNLQSIQNANLQLQALNESMNRALERRLLIERQIADTEAMPLPETSTPFAATAAQAPTNPRQRLDLARARLAALLQIYTPSHPEVVAQQRLVGELAAARGGGGAAWRGRCGSGEGAVSAGSGAAEESAGSQVRAAGGGSPAGVEPRGGSAAQETIAALQAQGGRAAQPRVGAGGVDARLQHAAGGVRQPADEAGRLDDCGQPRAAADRRAVPDPGPRVDAREAVQPDAAFGCDGVWRGGRVGAGAAAGRPAGGPATPASAAKRK